MPSPQDPIQEDGPEATPLWSGRRNRSISPPPPVEVDEDVGEGSLGSLTGILNQPPVERQTTSGPIQFAHQATGDPSPSGNNTPGSIADSWSTASLNSVSGGGWIGPLPSPTPTHAAVPIHLRRHTHPERASMVIVLVGLPGRGKSYVSRRICRWLNWNGIPCKIFNCGDYRRDLAGAGQDANYFGNSTQDRDHFCRLAMNDMHEWIEWHTNTVGILDATNHCRSRRSWVWEDLKGRMGADNILWVELICNDPKMIAHNIRNAKVSNKDYRGKDPDLATSDFLRRIEAYQKDYHPLNKEYDSDKSYVQWEDDTIKCHRVSSYLSKRIAYFLMNLSTKASVIYLTTPGESTYDVGGLKGAKGAILTDRGFWYNRAVAEFVRRDIISEHTEPIEEEKVARAAQNANATASPPTTPPPQSSTEGKGTDASPPSTPPTPTAAPAAPSSPPPPLPRLSVWTSQHPTGFSTGEQFAKEGLLSGVDAKISEWQALNELDHGVLDGKTIEHQRECYPNLEDEMMQDRFRHSYPCGESYQTMHLRLEPVLLEIENSSNPILIVADQHVLRGLIAYFQSTAPEGSLDVEAPSQNVFKCTFQASSVTVSTYPSVFEQEQGKCSILTTPSSVVSKG